MKRVILLIVIVLVSFAVRAQIAINSSGNDPDASAMLDIVSNSKGLLIPRMSASDRDNIASPATGLVVYVTDDNSFYYYDGTSWIQLQQAGKSWLLDGNSGVTSSQFLGTVDAADLHFKTNNTDRVIIDASGFVGVNATPGSATMIVGAANDEAIIGFSSGSSVFPGYFVNQDASGTGLLSVGNNTSPVYLTGGGGIASNGDDVGIFSYATNSSGTGLIAVGNGSSNVYTYSQGGGGAFNGSYNAIYARADQNDNNTITLYATVGASGSYDATAIYAYSKPSDYYGYGIVAFGGWYGIYGETDSNGYYAIYANGDFGASGTKNFVIDHPLDPANKYLKHFSIESNEVLNVYRGNVILDAHGEATVQLPSYFHAINRNFSYVLTPVGAPAPGIYIAEEIDRNGTFKIAGGSPGQKISWYVYAERNDPYLQQHPEKRKTEVEKRPKERGKYLMPELYGQPADKALVPIPEKNQGKKMKLETAHPDQKKKPVSGSSQR